MVICCNRRRGLPPAPWLTLSLRTEKGTEKSETGTAQVGDADPRDEAQVSRGSVRKSGRFENAIQGRRGAEIVDQREKSC